MAQRKIIRDQMILDFDNNRLFIELCGHFDCNLTLVERQLAVEIAPCGNRLYISGEEAVLNQAKVVLETLYRRLECGENVEEDDFKSALNWLKSTAAPISDNFNLEGVARIITRHKRVTARTTGQDGYIKALKRADMIFAIGPAGTGKTYLGVAYGVSLLEAKKVKRIILCRPAVEAGERLGFLPGDLREKIDPYLRPLYDALHDLLSAEQIQNAMQAGTIEIAPLAFIRGRTLDNAFIILDEAQNCRAMQMKMFLTRLGNDSKMVITGDPSQVDLAEGQISGLAVALNKLSIIEEIAFVRFSDKDIVRHGLVTRIVKAYDQASPGNGGNEP